MRRDPRSGLPDVGGEGLSVGVLREYFKNLVLFREVYEQTQTDVIGRNGVEMCLWDLENIYGQLEGLLSPRQWQAIELMLVRGYQETEVAVLMGISPNSPVGKYATGGLAKLLRLMDEGKVTGWLPPSVVFSD